MNATGAQTKSETPPLIDVSVIDGLRAAFGDRIAMLLSRTRSVIIERVGQIAERARDGASPEMARLAHEVGGMAGQVGLARLSAAALALEALCAGGDAADVARAAELVDVLARQSLAVLPAA